MTDVVRLSSLNVSMDVDTLQNLDSNVITVRTIIEKLITEWDLDMYCFLLVWRCWENSLLKK